MTENEFMIKNKLSVIKKLKNNYAIIRSEYGDHKIQLKQLNERHLPSIRSAINKEEWLISKAQKRHDCRYDYSEFKYAGIETRMNIICKEHGKFTTTVNHHVNHGVGCKQCAIEESAARKREMPSGWSCGQWDDMGNSSNNFDGFKVYIIECYNNSERFIKIGRTFTSLNRRFVWSSMLPYKFNIIKEVYGNARLIFELETKLKNNFKHFKHTPMIKFNGMYECFDIRIKALMTQ